VLGVRKWKEKKFKISDEKILAQTRPEPKWLTHNFCAGLRVYN